MVKIKFIHAIALLTVSIVSMVIASVSARAGEYVTRGKFTADGIASTFQTAVGLAYCSQPRITKAECTVVQ